MSKWEEISDILTKKAIKELKSGDKGDILMFEFEGSPIHLRIVRKTKAGKVYAKRTYAYLPDEADNEVQVISKKQA